MMAKITIPEPLPLEKQQVRYPEDWLQPRVQDVEIEYLNGNYRAVVTAEVLRFLCVFAESSGFHTALPKPVGMMWRSTHRGGARLLYWVGEDGNTVHRLNLHVIPDNESKHKTPMGTTQQKQTEERDHLLVKAAQYLCLEVSRHSMECVCESCAHAIKMLRYVPAMTPEWAEKFERKRRVLGIAPLTKGEMFVELSFKEVAGTPPTYQVERDEIRPEDV